MRMKLFAVAFLLTFTFTAHAQIEIPAACTEAAQEWYDAIDTDALIQAFLDAAETDNSTRSRFEAVDIFRETAASVAVRDSSCIADAAEWYAEGLERYAGALDEFIDNEIANYTVQSAKAYILIGQMRGYLAALGVELVDPEDNPLYFK